MYATGIVLFGTKWNALSRQTCEVSVKPDLTSDALQWFAICIFVHTNVLVTKNRIRRLVMRTDGYARTCLFEIREFDVDFTRKFTLKLGLFNLELLICHSKHWGVMKLLCFASATLPKLILIFSNRCYHFFLLKNCWSSVFGCIQNSMNSGIGTGMIVFFTFFQRH